MSNKTKQKQKYSKEQITQMLLIYQLKSIFTIGEIKTIFNWLADDTQIGEIDATNILEDFLLAKDFQRNILPEQVMNILEGTGCDPTTKEGLFKAILCMSTMTQYLKNIVQKVFDQEIL